jgi:hypothetical protein
MPTTMSISRSQARGTALLYLLMGLPGPLTLMYLPHSFVVSGDATATAQRMAEGMQTYRWLVLSDLISPIFFLLLAWNLYNLFEQVDRKQARLLVTFVAVSAVLGLVDAVVLMAPLELQSGAAFLSAFNKAQLDALTLGTFKLRDALLVVDEAFWGLWLLPFGILVIKSGFIPKFIGVFLIVGCFAWLALSFLGIVFPHAHRASDIAFYFVQPGELSILLWLLIKSLPPLPARFIRFARTGG